ncbi:hypothetical protein KP509_14G064200 [Ceratopteris richardii]|nr:hypothetical protein KP509_14G064200 [Ceratopteris richardii]
MPTEFLEKTKDQGRVVSWAPQIRILSHPSLGAFFSHCGWNSTLEAVTHGVPILCFPYFYDQFINAKYVVEVWEIGLLFISKLSLGEKGVVEREEIERLFKVMLEGEQSQKFQKNAIQLREAGRRTNLEGGTTYNNIKSLLKML